MTLTTDEATQVDDITAAGELLLLSVQHGNETVRRFAEAAAREVAKHGKVAAAGWLRGIWYVGGVRMVPGGDVSYHGIVLALQDTLGVSIVVGA